MGNWKADRDDDDIDKCAEKKHKIGEMIFKEEWKMIFCFVLGWLKMLLLVVF